MEREQRERRTHRLKEEREEAGEEEVTMNRTERKGVQDDDVEEEDEEEEELELEIELEEGEEGGDEFEDGLWLRPRGFIYNL